MTSASITGIAVLENVKQSQLENQSKTYTFDAQFYVNEAQTIIAGLRYFNAHDFKLKDMSTYVLCAHVVKPVEGAVIQSDDLTLQDYHILGDVAWLMPVDVDFCDLQKLRPHVNVCGLATDMNWTANTFVVKAVQYTTATKDVPRESSIFPAAFFVPDTPRFRNKKPMPSRDTYVFVSGYISRLDLSPTSAIERFIIEIDKVSFLGKKNGAFEVPTTPTPTRADSGKPKLRFSFDAKRKDSPRPVKRQRKETDDEPKESHFTQMLRDAADTPDSSQTDPFTA